jgi:hypothetical protein
MAPTEDFRTSFGSQFCVDSGAGYGSIPTTAGLIMKPFAARLKAVLLLAVRWLLTGGALCRIANGAPRTLIFERRAAPWQARRARLNLRRSAFTV